MEIRFKARRFLLHVIASSLGTTCGADSSFPVLFEHLKEWLVNHGGYVNAKLRATEQAFSSGGAAAGNDRGIVAGSQIEKDELLIFAPYSTLLRRAMVEKDPLISSVREALQSHRDRCGAWKPGCDLTVDPTWGGMQQVQLAVWLAKELQSNQSSGVVIGQTCIDYT